MEWIEAPDEGLGLIRNRVPARFNFGVDVLLGEGGGAVSAKRERVAEENIGDNGFAQCACVLFVYACWSDHTCPPDLQNTSANTRFLTKSVGTVTNFDRNERTLMLYTTLSPAEPTIFSPSLCQTLLPYSFQHRQPHKTSIPRQRNVSSASQAHLPYAGDLESSPVPVKSSARREFGSFGPWQHRSWPLSLVLSQPSLQIKQEGNARVPMMSSSVSAESYIWSIFFLRYSNGKPLTVGHLSMRTPTPRPWGGCAWIRPRILIGTHQSPSFSRQEARSL